VAFSKRVTLMQPAVIGGEDAYYRTILNTQPASLIALWRLSETSGAVANDSSPENNDGAYTGVALANAAGPDGVAVPYFDGANDYVDLHSAGLAADFNGAAGTLAIWVDANIAWADSNARIFTILLADTNNFLFIDKSAANTVLFSYKSGGTAKTVTLVPVTPASWFHVALTWDKANDELKAYYNGAQTGTTQTGLGVWAGALSSNQCLIGANTKTPTFVWDGWIGPTSLWKAVLTPAEILALSTV
jgi:hypothetical protein